MNYDLILSSKKNGNLDEEEFSNWDRTFDQVKRLLRKIEKDDLKIKFSEKVWRFDLEILSILLQDHDKTLHTLVIANHDFTFSDLYLGSMTGVRPRNLVLICKNKMPDGPKDKEEEEKIKKLESLTFVVSKDSLSQKEKHDFGPYESIVSNFKVLSFEEYENSFAESKEFTPCRLPSLEEPTFDKNLLAIQEILNAVLKGCPTKTNGVFIVPEERYNKLNADLKMKKEQLKAVEFFLQKAERERDECEKQLNEIKNLIK